VSAIRSKEGRDSPLIKPDRKYEDFFQHPVFYC
jgi:hypothetical protein